MIGLGYVREVSYKDVENTMQSQGTNKNLLSYDKFVFKSLKVPDYLKV